jgi:hypothetical protein
VAAKTTTFELVSNPSNSTKSWFRVESISPWAPRPDELRFFPMESISSMKIIAFFSCLAYLKSSQTLCAPTPTKTSKNSDPEM